MPGRSSVQSKLGASKRPGQKHSTLHPGVETDERGIATLTIRGKGSLNILGSEATADLTQAITALAETPGIRALVVRGAGDNAFIGGADIAEMAGLRRASAERFITGLRALCDALRRFPAPVVARLAGWSLGAGLEVALACDLRIAADDAKFGMPEVRVGIPSVIHAALLPRLIGKGRANWMLLTGEVSGAPEALSWGLVDRLVPLCELDAEVDRVASLLAGFGPSVMRQQKRLLREWEDEPLDSAIDRSVGEFGSAFETGEPQHYMGEFLRRKR